MSNRIFAMLACLSIVACATVESETNGTFTYRGTEYVALTRTYSSNGRTYQRRVIIDRNRRVSCSATDDLDCAAIIQQEWIDGHRLFR